MLLGEWAYEKAAGSFDETKLKVEIRCGNALIVEYRPERQEISKMPEPAQAAKEPEELKTNEELYLTGLHIEQYRHSTYLPDPDVYKRQTINCVIVRAFCGSWKISVTFTG